MYEITATMDLCTFATLMNSIMPMAEIKRLTQKRIHPPGIMVAKAIAVRIAPLLTLTNNVLRFPVFSSL
jgi:hypothetical protein